MIEPHQQCVGMMQGRLSPIRNGRIQSFPHENWQTELTELSKLHIEKLEWTIDSEHLLANPLMSANGCKNINEHRFTNSISVPSVTCDYFMENPPWQVNPKEVLGNLISIIVGMQQIDSTVLVIPLVDNSSIRNSLHTSHLTDYFKNLEKHLIDSKVRIAFETDLPPDDFLSFIEKFNPLTFGVNYDIGNSASLGFDPTEEFEAIGQRILNVHVKDRTLNGSTVPLGEGNADFELVFALLAGAKYQGNYILQTARAPDGNHAGSIIKYRNQVIRWLEACY